MQGGQGAWGGVRIDRQTKTGLGSKFVCEGFDWPSLLTDLGKILPMHLREAQNQGSCVDLPWKWNCSGSAALAVEADIPQMPSHKTERRTLSSAIEPSAPRPPWQFWDR